MQGVLEGYVMALLFVLLSGVSGIAMAASEGDAQLPPDVPDFWPEVADDLRRVTWAHAVNSRAELDAALSGNVMMLEADVSIADDGKTPIMAHPPATQSDLTLQQFLDSIIGKGMRKGAKLDFKSTEAFERAVPVLAAAAARRALAFPLWLNADIAAGPGGAAEPNVSAARFLELSAEHFPGRTLSVGWTTGDDAQRYTEQQTRAMEDALSAALVSDAQPLTFAVRAAPAARSHDTLLALLRERPRATLTLWGAAQDQVDNDALLQLAQKANFSRVYVDLPNVVPGLTPDNAVSYAPTVPRGDPIAPADVPAAPAAPAGGGGGASGEAASHLPSLTVTALATAAVALRRL